MSGYRVRDGDWEEIGRESPKKPQMFYPVSHPDMTVRKGDMLVSSACIFEFFPILNWKLHLM